MGELALTVLGGFFFIRAWDWVREFFGEDR